MLVLKYIGPLVVAAWLLLTLGVVVSWRRHMRSDPYPSEAAEAPSSVDEHFRTVPRELSGSTRYNEGSIVVLEAGFDWHAAEYMVKNSSKKVG